MKSNAFLKNLSWLVLLNVLVKPLWIFGIDRQLQVVVGHEAYGAYFSVLNLSLILGFICDAGLTNMLSRKLALGEHANTARLLRIKGGLALLYCGVVAGVAAAAGVNRWDLIGLVCIIQVLTSFLLFLRGVLTGHQLFRIDARVSVLDKALMIAVMGPLLYLPVTNSAIDLPLFLSIQAGCSLLTVMLTYALCRKFLSRHPAPAEPDSLLRAVAPFVVLLGVMTFHARFDGFFLERVHPEGAYEAGIYAGAYRLLDAGSMVGYLAASFLVPLVARHLQDQVLIEEIVLRLRHVLLLGAAGLLAFVAVNAPWVEHLLYGSNDVYPARVLVLVVGALPAYYLTHIYGSLLTARGALRLFILLVAGSVVLNVALNTALVPRLGAEGCALAALVSQWACALGCLAMGSRAFRISLQPLTLGGYAGAGFLLWMLFRMGGRAGFDEGYLALAGAFIMAMIMFVSLYRTRGGTVSS